MTPWRALACCAFLAFAAGRALAHDSWLVPTDGGLEVVTGARWPKVDLTAPPGSIARRGPDWVELHDFDITLEDKLVDVYVREAQPPAAVRERWQRLRTRGVAWQERYGKFMRIDRGGTAREPVGAALELVVSDRPAVGAPVRFTALSQGRPVPDLAVELVGERIPVGLWSKTDAQGQVQWTLPFAGRWLVRTIRIEPEGDDRWRSRFATLAFEAP